MILKFVSQGAFKSFSFSLKVFFFSIELIVRKEADKSSSEYFGLPQIKMYPMNSQSAASYYANTSHSEFCWWTLSWGKNFVYGHSFYPKGTESTFLNETLPLSWNGAMLERLHGLSITAWPLHSWWGNGIFLATW